MFFAQTSNTASLNKKSFSKSSEVQDKLLNNFTTNNKGLKLAVKDAFLSTQENFSALVPSANRNKTYKQKKIILQENGKLHNNHYYR